MITIRRSVERGITNHGWLNSRHTFSFSDYHDSRYMGFGPLRVINEDKIDGGTGFAKHPHCDMEIISYVIEGALRHEDTMGNKTIIRPGDVQKMSAGTGILHSEMNDEPLKQTHFLQIWIVPQTIGEKPSYGQKSFTFALESVPLVLAVSGDGRDGSIQIHQDANIYLGKLTAGTTLPFDLKPSRNAWVQVVKGVINIAGNKLYEGDGVSVTLESRLELIAYKNAEIILFDLPLN